MWHRRAKNGGTSISSEQHTAELADLRHLRPDWADRVEAAAIAPDPPKDAAA